MIVLLLVIPKNHQLTVDFYRQQLPKASYLPQVEQIEELDTTDDAKKHSEVLSPPHDQRHHHFTHRVQSVHPAVGQDALVSTNVLKDCNINHLWSNGSVAQW